MHHPSQAPAHAQRFLADRRSCNPTLLTTPAPNAEQLATILTIASRTPDHGKLVPYRFITLDHAACVRMGDHVQAAFARDNPDAPEEALRRSRQRFDHAPMIVAVVCRARPGDPRAPKIPEFEQLMTCGAVCMNLLHGAHALGFGAIWLTGWTTYDQRILSALGLEPGERLSGWIHLGTQAEPREDRERPDLSKIVSPASIPAVEERPVVEFPSRATAPER
ncbi:MAG: nitroreductase [Planctomycetota bacterium]